MKKEFLGSSEEKGSARSWLGLEWLRQLAGTGATRAWLHLDKEYLKSKKQAVGEAIGVISDEARRGPSGAGISLPMQTLRRTTNCKHCPMRKPSKTGCVSCCGLTARHTVKHWPCPWPSTSWACVPPSFRCRCTTRWWAMRAIPPLPRW